jgi:hypothetical protein
MKSRPCRILLLSGGDARNATAFGGWALSYSRTDAV